MKKPVFMLSAAIIGILMSGCMSEDFPEPQLKLKPASTCPEGYQHTVLKDCPVDMASLEADDPKKEYCKNAIDDPDQLCILNIIDYSGGGGINCDAHFVTVTPQEATRGCVTDESILFDKSSANADKFLCKAGKVDGKMCRKVPDEINNSVIGIAPDQRCTKDQADPPADTLRIHVMDVGQGDAIWIQTPDGKNVLIDAGDGGFLGKTSAGPIIADYLSTHGFDKAQHVFDAVFLTHPHSDHFGGFSYLFKSEKYKLINYIDSIELDTKINIPSSYRSWISHVSSLVSKSNLYMPAEAKFKPGQDFSEVGDFFGKQVKAIYVTSDKTRSDNGASMIIKLTYAGVSMVFTGDAEGEQEAKAIANAASYGFDLSAQILKIAHHGSESNGSSSMAFLNAVWPETVDKIKRIGIISSGRTNFSGSYLPSKSTVKKLTTQFIDPLNLYSTSAGDGTNDTDSSGKSVEEANKDERDSYRDDNLLIVIRSDGTYYSCYNGTN